MGCVNLQKKVIFLVMLMVVGLVSTCGCVSDPVDTGVNDSSSDEDNSQSSQSSSSSSSQSSNVCPECGGTGEVACYNTATGGTSCAGTGIVQGGGTSGLTCRICGGSGVITCPTCGGSGEI